jgi:DNA repair protein RadD
MPLLLPPVNDHPLWPHLARGVDGVIAAATAGHRSIAVTAPTGSGKTSLISELARRASAKYRRAVVFTNRRILLKQASETLEDKGVVHGVIAAGERPRSLEWVQVASLQTVTRRWHAYKKEPPPAEAVIIDEGHRLGETVLELIEYYKARRAVIVLVTATPVGLGNYHEVGGKKERICSVLVTAGTQSELRKAGIMVPCDVFAPDEPDMRGIKLKGDGEYPQKAAGERMRKTTVIGDVIRSWRTVNPQRKPTILWAPTVADSEWFAQQFRDQGVSALHVDGDTDDAERKKIFADSRSGALRVVCSCGVLREGVDMPWIEVGILLTPCGLLSTFLQVCGRLLRACKDTGKERAVLIDHVGAFHRHGSPNVDRHWRLEDDDKTIARKRREALQAGTEREPIRCPKCSGVRSTGGVCPFCGHKHVRSVRMIRMVDGSLRRQVGDVVKKKKLKTDEERTWTNCLRAAAFCGRTLKQAAGHYKSKMGKWPYGLPHLPPFGSLDWDRRVEDVIPWMKRVRQKKGT